MRVLLTLLLLFGISACAAKKTFELDREPFISIDKRDRVLNGCASELLGFNDTNEFRILCVEYPDSLFEEARTRYRNAALQAGFYAFSSVIYTSPRSFCRGGVEFLTMSPADQVLFGLDSLLDSDVPGVTPTEDQQQKLDALESGELRPPLMLVYNVNEDKFDKFKEVCPNE